MVVIMVLVLATTLSLVVIIVAVLMLSFAVVTIVFILFSLVMAMVVVFVLVLVFSFAVVMVVLMLVPASHNVVKVVKKPVVTTITLQNIGCLVIVDRNTTLEEIRAIEPRFGAGTADVGHAGAERSSRVPLCKDGQERIPIVVKGCAPGDQNVIIFLPPDTIGPQTADEEVATLATTKLVVAIPTYQDIGTVIAIKLIVAGAAVEDVVTIVTFQLVISIPA